MDTTDSTKQSSSTRHWARLGVLLAGIGVTIQLFTQDPGKGGPVTILIFLLLVFIFSLCITDVVLTILVKVCKQKPFSWLRRLYTGVAVASGVVFLLGLQSLGQLQFVDICLLFIFEGLLNFYLLRRF